MGSKPSPLNTNPLKHRFTHLPIAHKLGILNFILTVLFGALLCVDLLGVSMLSAVRAYVGGEGLWSKAQKQASYRLLRYAWKHQAGDYERFLRALDVPFGDRQARLELEKPSSDDGIIYEGFVRGGIHPDDISGMIHLFKWFRHF